MTIRDVFLFWLDNNRKDFIERFIVNFPNVQIESFWNDYENQTNEQIADKLIIWIDKNKLWDKFSKIKFLYNKNAQNYTTDESLSSQVAILNGVKPLNETDTFLNYEKSSTIIEKNFWTSLGDFFSGHKEGDITTTTTTVTTTKTNAFVLIGAVIGIVAVILVVNKFL